MKRSRFTEEQIIAMLKEQEAGMSTADVCRKHGVSSATFYKFKARYGGLEVSDARRLKALDGLAPVSPDSQAVSVLALMNSRGERHFRPECGWLSL